MQSESLRMWHYVPTEITIPVRRHSLRHLHSYTREHGGSNSLPHACTFLPQNFATYRHEKLNLQDRCSIFRRTLKSSNNDSYICLCLSSIPLSHGLQLKSCILWAFSYVQWVVLKSALPLLTYWHIFWSSSLFSTSDLFQLIPAF